MTLYQGRVITQIEAKATMKVENPDLTMDEAERKLVELGNSIIERDDEARTFVVMHTIDRED